MHAEEVDAAVTLRPAAETPSASVCSTDALGRHTTEMQTTQEGASEYTIVEALREYTRRKEERDEARTQR